MVAFAAASVVLVPFPFSDLSEAKLRPAVVLAKTGAKDWMLCQITSNPYSDRNAVPVSDWDFSQGSLRRESVARPSKLFTVSAALVVAEVGRLRPDKFREIISAVIALLQAPSMAQANAYQLLVSEYARLLQTGKSHLLGGFARSSRSDLTNDSPKVLIFAPHPDDECIIGGLSLRLLRQARMRVINVAVTQGSKKERQAERFKELQGACAYMGYGLIQTRPNGLEKINARTRAQEPKVWAESVQIIAGILAENRPRVIFFPHEQDWNSTHIGTHFLVIDALESLGSNFACFVVETEFWGAMATPNLMVESTSDDVADMVAGTSFHVGEVERNPFHLFLPAWMQDNVRRGSELVGGQGEAAPDFTFATLYRLRRWNQGRLEKVLEGGKILPSTLNPASLFV